MFKFKYNFKYIYAVILCVLLFVSGLFLHAPTAFVCADAPQYTDLITDLKKDETFNISNYPAKGGDYGIEIIQIAESENNELFIYTYQPCRVALGTDKTQIELSPTQISMAVATDLNNLRYTLYGLTEVNRYSTLTKYVVNGCEVNPLLLLRYYSVSMLQRKTIDGLDEAVEVGKLWTVETTENGVKYSERHKETIEILNPVAGAVRYQKDKVPANWGKDGCDNHFIAFDTDLPIDDLLEADVSYMTVAIGDDVGAPKGKFITIYELVGIAATNEAMNGDQDNFAKLLRDYAINHDKISSGNVTVRKSQKYTFGTGGWFSEKQFSWNRIMTMPAFVNSWGDGKVCGMTGAYDIDDMKTRKWVLCYRETPYDQVNSIFEEWFDGSTGGYWYDLDIVVLRLKFETNGTVYDMGTVSNKVNQTVIISGNKPETVWDSITGFFASIGNWFSENWHWILIAVLGIILLIVLMPFMPVILSFLATCLKYLFKGLVWLISLPVKGIAALVRKIKEKRAEKAS